MFQPVRAAIGAGVIAGAALLGTAPPATAQPPNCTSADLAGVMSGVAAAASAYLFTHPDVNAFLTSLKGQPKDQIRAQVQEYLDANPQVRADFQSIRQPTQDFRERCGQPAAPE